MVGAGDATHGAKGRELIEARTIGAKPHGVPAARIVDGLAIRPPQGRVPDRDPPARYSRQLPPPEMYGARPNAAKSRGLKGARICGSAV